MQKILERTSFGIEIETCMRSRKFGGYSMKKFYNHLVELAKTKGENIWENPEKNINLDYSMWNIIEDSSIKCHSEKYQFFPVEIISPIFKANENDLKKLSVHWNTYIKTEGLWYLVNETQGFHIHISNPKLDKKRLLKLWYVFEDVFFILFPERKNNDYTRSIRKELKKIQKECKCCIFENIDDDYPILTRYYTFNGEIPEKNHVEIRIHPGTIRFIEIYNWIKLVLLFVGFSIMYDIPNSTLRKWDRFSVDKKLYFLFTDIIRDKRSIRYYFGTFIPSKFEILQKNYKNKLPKGLDDFKKKIEKYNLNYPDDIFLPSLPIVKPEEMSLYGVF